MTDTHTIEVFHDGDCPVCQMEIRFYDRIDRSGKICWTDITALSDETLPDGKSRDELLGKFHVRERTASDSNWYVGMDAFARIWRELPVFKYFAWVFSVPGIRQLAELGYRGFLRWQQNHRKKRKQAEASA